MPKVVPDNHVTISKGLAVGKYQFFFYDPFFKDPFTFKVHEDCIEFKRAIISDKNIQHCKKSYNAYRCYLILGVEMELGHTKLDDVDDEDVRTITRQYNEKLSKIQKDCR